MTREEMLKDLAETEALGHKVHAVTNNDQRFAVGAYVALAIKAEAIRTRIEICA